MSAENDTARGTWVAARERREPYLVRFEEAWQCGQKPAIDDYLPDGEDRYPVLLDLAFVDLEYRLMKVDDQIR